MREAAEFSLLSHALVPNDRSMGMNNNSIGMNNNSIGMSLAAPSVLGVTENTNNQSLSTVREEEESDINAVSESKERKNIPMYYRISYHTLYQPHPLIL